MVHGRPFRHLSAALLLAAAVGSCRDLSTMPEEGRACSTKEFLGVFQGRAAGAATDSLAGCALFTTDTITREFAMVLTNGGLDSYAPMVKLFRRRAPKDGVIYTINVGTDSLWGVMFLGNRRFFLSGGTFQILPADRGSYASSWFMEGRLNVTATDSVGATLTVSGEFRGVCVGAQEVPDRREDPIDKKVKACDPTFAALRAPEP